jgi:hypothetical protein
VKPQLNKHILLYEFQDFDFSKEDIADLSSRKLIISSKGRYSFEKSGSFLTKKNIYIVLPWVLKDEEEGELKETEISFNSDPALYLLNVFRWVKIGTNSISLTAKDITSGREFIFYTLLKQLEKMVNNGISHNVFRIEIKKRDNIKGKWLVSTDTMKEETPIRFTCASNECDKNHPILMVARRYSGELAIKARSQVVKKDAERLSSFLSQYAEWPNNVERTIQLAEIHSSVDKRFKDWMCWLSVLRWAAGPNLNRSLVDLGTSSDLFFPTDRFFESIVERAITLLNFRCVSQQSGKILGGSYWKGRRTVLDSPIDEDLEDVDKKAKNSSRPDFLIYGENSLPLLLECKYKQLEIAFSSGTPVIKNFYRNDRNQLLSFILSSSEDLRFQSDNIIVIFPLANYSLLRAIPTLCYSATLKTLNKVEEIKWGPSIILQNLRIYFLGIDLKILLKEVYSPSQPKRGEIFRLKCFLEERLKIKKAA